LAFPSAFFLLIAGSGIGGRPERACSAAWRKAFGLVPKTEVQIVPEKGQSITLWNVRGAFFLVYHVCNDWLLDALKDTRMTLKRLLLTFKNDAIISGARSIMSFICTFRPPGRLLPDTRPSW